MKPSDVVLHEPCPLVDTFHHAEAEAAAAWLIFVMARRGDEFVDVWPKEMGEVVANVRNSEDEKLPSWFTCPFLRPDFDRLIEDGYAERVSPEMERKSPLRFTQKGLDKLKASRWTP